MRHLKVLGTVAALAAASALAPACSDTPTTADASVDAATAPTDAPPPVDSAVDTAAPDSARPDAAVDAPPPPGAIPDGRYVLQSWVCTRTGTTVDIKAFALTLQIQEIAETFAGSSGSVEVTYPAGCVRTVPLSGVAYPTPGTVTTTAGGARTCTASCPSNQCTPGTEPPVTVTYQFTFAAPTLTATRTYVADTSLQSIAGCMAGDTETAVYAKQ